jgi:hypothetical protein
MLRWLTDWYWSIDWENQLNRLGAIIVAATTVVGALTVFLGAWRRLLKRDQFTDQRVTLLWEAYIRQGKVKGLIGKRLIAVHDENGVNMPYQLRDDIRKAYAFIWPRLEEVYRQWKTGDPRLTLAEAIEGYVIPATGKTPAQRMGDWLTQHICLVYEMTDQECVAMAELLLRERYEQPAAAAT